MVRKLPLIVALLGLTGLVAAGCGADYERASAQSDAQALLRETAGATRDLRSATVALKVGVDGKDASLAGAFAIEEEGRLPKFALTATQGRERAGAVWTGKTGYVTVEGKTYEVPGLVMGQVAAGYEQAVKARPGVGVDFTRWVRDVRNEGAATVGGVETVKLTGTGDAARVISDLEQLFARAGALTVFGVDLPGRLTSKHRQEAVRAIESLTVTVYTGAEDRILRRLVVAGTVEGDPVRLDLTLTRVGSDQRIAAPKGARPFSELLIQKTR